MSRLMPITLQRPRTIRMVLETPDPIYTSSTFCNSPNRSVPEELEGLWNRAMGIRNIRGSISFWVPLFFSDFSKEDIETVVTMLELNRSTTVTIEMGIDRDVRRLVSYLVLTFNVGARIMDPPPPEATPQVGKPPVRLRRLKLRGGNTTEN